MSPREKKAAEILERLDSASAALRGMLAYQVDHDTKGRAVRDLARLVVMVERELGVDEVRGVRGAA